MISDNVKLYCCEDITKIENYENAVKDETQMWHCHHRLETHNSDGERRLVEISYKELKALGMYFNRPASELIFLTSKEHRALHMYNNKETRKKMSAAQKGNTNALGHKHSEETKKKMSESMKGKNRGPKSEETKTKMSAAQKGNTNALGHKVSEEARKKMSESMKGIHKGKHWKLVDGKRVWY